MGELLGTIGILGFIGCLVWLIISAFKKQKKRNSLVGISVALILFIVGVANNPSSQSASVPMASSRVDSLSTPSLSKSDTSYSNLSADASMAKLEKEAEPIVDKPDALFDKVQEIVKDKFNEGKISVQEYHLKANPSNKTVSVSIQANSYNESTPDEFIEAAKSTFISSKIAYSEYHSLVFSFALKNADDNIILVISKVSDGNTWSSGIGAAIGSHKDAFDLAYEKSAFFSDLDLMKQSEKSFDEIAKEYNIG